ncbi:unnamed protein product [Diabrotica balteata]|uniref:Uncharacterized protein n=1 Tax=Diabrotica balteata TaxID=107213 RepID=A0A9N9SZ97_DIABA|nr:unnamed protein product [Diabrotica balteata]
MNCRPRVIPVAQAPPSGNINHELPPPSYDDVMREIRHERARSMISRR